MIAIARVVFPAVLDGNGGFISIKVPTLSTLGELKLKVLHKVGARLQKEQSLEPEKFSLLYLEGEGIAKTEDKLTVSWFLRSEASPLVTFFLLPKGKDAPTPATRAYCLALADEVLPKHSSRNKSPPKDVSEVKIRTAPPVLQPESPSVSLHRSRSHRSSFTITRGIEASPRVHRSLTPIPQNELVLSPTAFRRSHSDLAQFTSPTLRNAIFVQTDPAPSPLHRRHLSVVIPSPKPSTPVTPHRRALSTPSGGELQQEVVEIPTPTTRARSGGDEDGTGLFARTPNTRIRERWTSASASDSVPIIHSPRNFAELEHRTLRSARPRDGGFRELVMLLAAMKRSKGVSDEQQYQLKAMMLSRDPEEFKKAKDFLEELDSYTEQNDANSEHPMHTLYPHMSDLDDVSKIIHTQKGYYYFFSFLEQEYSQENLLFWRAVKDFERDYASDKSTAEIKEHAMRLWGEYIGPEASNMINLSSDTVKSFRDQLFPKTRFSTDLLLQACEAAKLDIEQLLSRDSFQRFKKSPLYTKLCEESQLYHTPQKREKRRGGSDLIREFFGRGESA